MLPLLAAAALGMPTVPALTKYHTTPFPSKDNRADPSVPDLSLFPILSQKIGGHTGNDAPSEFFKYIPSEGVVAVCNDGGKALDIYTLDTHALKFTLENSIDLSPNAPQSLDYNKQNGVLVLALDTGGRGPAQYGEFAVFDLSTLTTATAPLFTKSAMGILPDHVSFSPNGHTLNIAIEAEPMDDFSHDGTGGVTSCTSTDWKNTATYACNFVSLAIFDPMATDIQMKGIHLPATRALGNTVGQSLEPEYITYSEDSSTAYVACQENNAMAVLDLTAMPPVYTELRPLGYKSLEAFPADVSDSDDTLGNIRSWPNVWSMFQPDTITSYTAPDGKRYIVTANEGDAQDYDGFSEEARVKDVTLDPTVFPDAATLQADEHLGRMKMTTQQGDEANDGAYEYIVGFGGRSFSIWDAETGMIVWDSGSQAEQIMAAKSRTFVSACARHRSRPFIARASRASRGACLPAKSPAHASVHSSHPPTPRIPSPALRLSAVLQQPGHPRQRGLALGRQGR